MLIENQAQQGKRKAFRTKLWKLMIRFNNSDSNSGRVSSSFNLHEANSKLAKCLKLFIPQNTCLYYK